MIDVVELGLGVKEVIPARFEDHRGYFAEVWHQQQFSDAGISCTWLQDNQSFSARRHTLRGLHLQAPPFSQTKLVRVLRGSVFDVAVDVRPGSPSFGKWVGCVLSAWRLNQIFIPTGFAHGFLTLEPDVEVLYKVSGKYVRESERSILWNDPDLGIDWPLGFGEVPTISAKDANALTLADFKASMAAEH